MGGAVGIVGAIPDAPRYVRGHRRCPSPSLASTAWSRAVSDDGRGRSASAERWGRESGAVLRLGPPPRIHSDQHWPCCWCDRLIGGDANPSKACCGGVSPTDPLTFALVTVSLAAAAALPAYVPARRALGINPIAALRIE